MTHIPPRHSWLSLPSLPTSVTASLSRLREAVERSHMPRDSVCIDRIIQPGQKTNPQTLPSILPLFLSPLTPFIVVCVKTNAYHSPSHVLFALIIRPASVNIMKGQVCNVSVEPQIGKGCRVGDLNVPNMRASTLRENMSYCTRCPSVILSPLLPLFTGHFKLPRCFLTVNYSWIKSHYVHINLLLHDYLIYSLCFHALAYQGYQYASFVILTNLQLT